MSYPETSNTQLKPSHVLLRLVCIIALWALTHLFTLSWGLPNYFEDANDSLVLHFNEPTLESMRRTGCIYPPLQYLLWDWTYPLQPAEGTLSASLQQFSSRLWRCRMVTAVLTLAAALALYAVGECFYRIGPWALIPPALFLLNPMSIFYSHTTNMDMPYVAWYTLSLAVFLATNLRRRPWWLNIGGNVLFAVLMAFSFCTKDQIYAIYILPLIAYQVWQFREGNWRRAVMQGLIWCGTFAGFVAGIYHLAGGHEILRIHWTYITGFGIDGFQQAQGFLGRITLIGRTVADLIVALDWPVTTFALVILALSWQRRDRDLRLLTSLTLLTLLSQHLLFTQVTCFTFPRFLLPLLPLVTLTAGVAVARLRTDDMRIQIGIATLLAVTLPIAVIPLQRFRHDTRLVLRKEMRMLQEQQAGAQIAVAGSQFSQALSVVDSRHRRWRTIRDWSGFRFGLLAPEQQSIMVNDYYLHVLQPDFVVVNKMDEAKARDLEEHHYEHVRTIADTSPQLSLFGWRPATFSIYQHRPQKRKKMNADNELTFNQQLLIFQACLEMGNTETYAKRFGQICDEFQEPDLHTHLIKRMTCVALVHAYEQNKRTQSALAAKEFLWKIRSGQE